MPVIFFSDDTYRVFMTSLKKGIRMKTKCAALIVSIILLCESTSFAQTNLNTLSVNAGIIEKFLTTIHSINVFNTYSIRSSSAAEV